MQRTRRRLWLTLTGVLALVATVAACAPMAVQNAPRDKVTLALSTLENPFFKELRGGARSTAKISGVRVDVVAAHNDLTRQARQLRRAAKNNVDAVVVNPVDSEAAALAVRPLLKADIPVIAVDREIVGAEVASTITSDNVEGGQQAAEVLAESVEFSGEVIHLRGALDTTATRERTRGFEQVLAQYEDVEIVAQKSAGFDQDEARRVTERLLKANPGVEGIFAGNDEMALGAIEALGERAGSDVKVVGYDGTTAALRAIEQGKMVATVAQVPEQLGQVAMEQAIAAIDGAPVAPTVPVGVELVTAGNVGQYL